MHLIRCLFILVLVISSASVGAQPPEEKMLANDLMKQLVGFCKIVLEDMDPAQPGVCYARMPEEHNQTPCYPLAYLYKTKHPLNPFYGNQKIRDRAIAICDHIVKEKSVLEWPLYSLSQVYGLLEHELDEVHKQSWLGYAKQYMKTRGIRPFFYTSFNHEAWNATAILRAGQVFNKPGWTDRAKRMMHQLIKVQNELGYFDEGPHHGPSMKYNQAQLAPMLLFVDYTGDEEVLASAKKLADFMIRYSFPDGSLISCFDGRQDWYIGYFGSLCYGMDRWPLGKEHNRRFWCTRKKWGIFSTESKYYNTFVTLDGKPPENEDKVNEVNGWVELTNPTTETRIRISVPEGLDTALRPPVQPLRWYAGDHGVQRFEPFYDIRLLSVRINKPEGKGIGEFRISISGL